MKRFFCLLFSVYLLLLAGCGDSGAQVQEAYDNGLAAGYAEGYEAAQEEAASQLEDQYDAGYEAGLAAGEATGYDSGYADGYDTGSTDGYDLGYDDGSVDSYESGYASGTADGNATGYDLGYTEGYEAAAADIALQSSAETDSSENAETLSPVSDEPVATTAAADAEEIVYVTNTGTKYHKDGCSSLSASKIPISLSDAIAQGYTACSRCH